MSSVNCLTLRASEHSVHYGRRRIQVSIKEFDLYALLALKRVEGTDDGFIATDEVLQLASWGRNKIESVGKQIRRHIESVLEPAGLRLIESPQKIKGPFRLVLAAERIDLGMRPDELREKLGVADAIAALGEGQRKRFYQFVISMWRGFRTFNEGRLSEALRHYTDAWQNAVFPHHRILATWCRSRVLDRTGEEQHARDLMESAHELLSRVRQDRDWAAAKVYSMLGWLVRRQDKDEAADWYLKAQHNIRTQRNHQIAAAVYNGLGLIAKDRGQFRQAAAFYHQALECAILAEDYYMVQASYFNLGRMHSMRADLLWKGDHFGPARVEYRLAAAWVEECVTICDELVLAEDTSEDRILLAHIYSRLDKLDQAYQSARDAYKMATRANNQRCIALASRELAAIHILRGSMNQAHKVIADCKSRVKPEFLKLLREAELFSLTP